MTAHPMFIDRGFEHALDEELAALSCFQGAREQMLSPMLPTNFVLAKNYLKSFPQHAFSLSNEIHADQSYLLSPTCCYPVFHALAGTETEAEMLITHKNMCFRCEDYYKSGERQISFLMREYIYLSEDLDAVTAWIENVKSDVSQMLKGLGLQASLEVATDPFFNANDYKQKIQKNQELKHEFLIDDLAVGSVNLHLKAFSRSCSIKSPSGNELYSSCFGLGYDRVYFKYKGVQASKQQHSSPEPAYART